MSKTAKARGPWVDISALLFPVLLVLTIAAPLGRGLYFAPERDTFEIIVAVLLLVLALHLLFSGQGPIGTHWMDWAVMAYALGYWIAYLVHPVVPYSALEGALRGGMYVAWYWLIVGVVRRRERIVWYVRTLYASGVLLALLGCLAAAGKFHFPAAASGQRILSTLQYANALGAMLDFTFILGLALWEHALSDPHLKPGNSGIPLGLYGAGNFLTVLTLLGTVSRGAWLVLPVGLGIWFFGLERDRRGRALFFILWPTGLALLLSRPILDGFWGHQGGHALAVLAVGTVVGGVGTGLYRWAVRVWERQRYPIEVRRTLQALVGVYVLGVLGFLLLSTGRAAAALAGRGLVAGSVASRASTISAQTPDFLQRIVMWHDALRLVPRSPLLGLGGGAWAALYHEVQSAPYWSTQVHESLLQAWLGGGLLAAVGLAVGGGGVLILGCRRRREGGSALPLLWGVGVGAFALFLHSLADFDLSLPALALVVWGAAGALRGAAPATDAARPSRWWWGLVGVVVAGSTGLVLLLPATRMAQAASLAGNGAAAMSAKQYAVAYEDYRAALRREPLAPTYLADEAQLLVLAYTVNHGAVDLQRGADVAEAAEQFGHGNLLVASVALGILDQAGHWQQEATDAEALIREFPVDPEVYDYAGPALVNAAEGEIQEGSYASAGAALRQVQGFNADLRNAYHARAKGLALLFFPHPELGVDANLAVGESSALLGLWSRAIQQLTPLVRAGSGSIADESRVWLAVAEERAGQGQQAALTIAPLEASAQWMVAFQQGYQLTAFSGEVDQHE